MKNFKFLILLAIIFLTFTSVITFQEYNKQKSANNLIHILTNRGVPYFKAKHLALVKYHLIAKDSLYVVYLEDLYSPNSGYDFMTKQEVDTLLNINL